MKMRLQGIKHLIECHCILPQYRNIKNPIYHKFIVFSIIDESDNVQTKYVQCNNCGVIHKVNELSKSELLIGKEHLSSVISIDDMKLSLPEQLSNILISYNAPIYVWEHCQFILDNKQWGEQAIIDSNHNDDMIHGKKIVILANDRFRIETFDKRNLVKFD